MLFLCLADSETLTLLFFRWVMKVQGRQNYPQPPPAEMCDPSLCCATRCRSANVICIDLAYTCCRLLMMLVMLAPVSARLGTVRFVVVIDAVGGHNILEKNIVPALRANPSWDGLRKQ